MPASSPGAVMSVVASSRPSGFDRLMAIDRLPLLSPAQYRLTPSSVTGQRR